jgi:hypothetical protein
MSKPLAWFLQLLGLVLILSGWSTQNWTILLIGVVLALFGAIGIRNRIKADQRKK